MRLPESVWLLLARAWPYRDVSYPEPVGGLAASPRSRSTMRARLKAGCAASHPLRMQALVDEGVLTALSDDDDTIEIDNQEQLALQFFLAEVYYAWSQYQTRIARWRKRRDNAIKRRKERREL